LVQEDWVLMTIMFDEWVDDGHGTFSLSLSLFSATRVCYVSFFFLHSSFSLFGCLFFFFFFSFFFSHVLSTYEVWVSVQERRKLVFSRCCCCCCSCCCSFFPHSIQFASHVGIARGVSFFSFLSCEQEGFGWISSTFHLLCPLFIGLIWLG